jgi:alpha-ribazole phosphatase
MPGDLADKRDIPGSIFSLSVRGFFLTQGGYQMTTTLLLARHARVGSEYEGRYIGAEDIPLDTDAEDEIAILAEAILPYKPAIICSSPLQRARRTAEGVANHLRLPVTDIRYRDSLREVDFGRWEGLSFQEIATSAPELVEQWTSGYEAFRFPAGEEICGFVQRVAGAAEYACGLPEDVVLLVTHGGVIRTMLCHLLDLSPRNYLLFEVKLASLTVMRVFNGRGVLAGLNLGTVAGE